MKKVFILLFCVLLFFTLVRAAVNINNDALQLNEFVEKVSAYDFSFSNTYQNFQVIGQLATTLPELNMMDLSPPDSALEIIPWLGEFFTELWDFLMSFFYFLGQIFLIIGRAIATVFFIAVDVAKNFMHVLDIIAYLCGFSTPTAPDAPGGGGIETSSHGGGPGHQGGRMIENVLSKSFRGRGNG